MITQENFRTNSVPWREHAAMNSRQQNSRKRRGFGRRTAITIAALVVSLWFAPSALAHTRVGFGISIGAGNCWSCGYWAAPPVYYTPAYPPPPAYYAPRTVYYAPRPVYYGYGYYGYYAPRHYRWHYRYHRGRDYAHGGWHYHRGHYYHGHR